MPPEPPPNDRGRASRSALLVLLALVLVGVLARTWRIDAPLLEYRFYRQQDTAALARNFAEGRMNILYPQVDWRGDTPGYAEAEFQLYTFAVALLYKAFGVHEWLGRALNIAIYAASAALLFHFARRLYDERAALLAVFFYTVAPLSFYFTRAFQNDATTALASLAGLHFFWRWTDTLRRRDLALSALGVAVAALIKPPSLYLGLPLVYLCVRRFGWSFLRRGELWAFAAAAILPAVLWYRHSLELWETYGNTFGVLGLKSVIGHWPAGDPRWLELPQKLVERTALLIATPPGLLFLAIGALARRPRPDGLVLWWLGAFAIYVLLVPRGHLGHEHYQLPIVFAAAALMGRGATLLIDRGLLSRAAVLVLCLLAAGASIWRVQRMLEPWPRQQRENEQHLAFAARVQELTEPDAPMVFVVPEPFDYRPPEIYRHRYAPDVFLYCDPQDFYLSHRKGWSLDDFLATPELVEELRQRGARYLATFHPGRVFERRPELKALLDERHTRLDVRDRWAIYRLEHAAR